jgi:hypothetical protein
MFKNFALLKKFRPGSRKIAIGDFGPSSIEVNSIIRAAIIVERLKTCGNDELGKGSTFSVASTGESNPLRSGNHLARNIDSLR